MDAYRSTHDFVDGARCSYTARVVLSGLGHCGLSSWYTAWVSKTLVLRQQPVNRISRSGSDKSKVKTCIKSTPCELCKFLRWLHGDPSRNPGATPRPPE